MRPACARSTRSGPSATAVSKPVNVLARTDLTLAQIAAAGGRRISVGGALAWVAADALAAAAQRIRDEGDFSALDVHVPPAGLACSLSLREGEGMPALPLPELISTRDRSVGVDHARSEERSIALAAVQWRGSSAGQLAGQESGVAVERNDCRHRALRQRGCSSRISAATPAACGEAIDVPLIHTYRPPPLTTARLAPSRASHSPGLVGARPASKDAAAPETSRASVRRRRRAR